MMQAALAMKSDIPLQQENQHTAERMADAIQERMSLTGQCSIQDMKAKGFSISDIARYWPEACAIVETKRPRQC
jgi:hypothetical protein